jgi:hypothetical protein
MTKTITTKRIRLDPTQARTSKAMGGLVVANKPPPASRHRAVLLLRKDVSLFDMRDNSSANARDIIVSSSNSRPMMMVETISTNCVSGVEDPRYVELMASFYTRVMNCKNPCSKKLTYKLIMPKDWTPRMYLGALNWSIINNSLVSIESVALDTRSYATTNELNWLFSLPVNESNTRLTTSASYLRVAGGNYQSKSPY